jgi:hypothetical protein
VWALSPSFLVSSLIFLCSTEKTKEKEKTLVNFSSELGSSCVIIRFPIGSMIATKWAKANQSVYMPMQASKQEHLRIKIFAWVPPGVTPFIKKKKGTDFLCLTVVPRLCHYLPDQSYPRIFHHFTHTPIFTVNQIFTAYNQHRSPP